MYYRICQHQKESVFLSDLAPVIQVPRSIGSGSRAHVEVSQSQGSARPVTLYTLKPEPILVCEGSRLGFVPSTLGKTAIRWRDKVENGVSIVK